jgi:hypothetical protein
LWTERRLASARRNHVMAGLTVTLPALLEMLHAFMTHHCGQVNIN